MPNRHLAYHPRFLANFKITIEAPFNAGATKQVHYDDTALKGLKTDMVISAQVDGESGAVVIGATCIEDDSINVIFRNISISGAKANLTLTVAGL